VRFTHASNLRESSAVEGRAYPSARSARRRQGSAPSSKGVVAPIGKGLELVEADAIDPDPALLGDVAIDSGWVGMQVLER
jgi:hypothetical protein